MDEMKWLPIIEYIRRHPMEFLYCVISSNVTDLTAAINTFPDLFIEFVNGPSFYGRQTLVHMMCRRSRTVGASAVRPQRGYESSGLREPSAVSGIAMP